MKNAEAKIIVERMPMMVQGVMVNLDGDWFVFNG
jgi:hypothetical protein